MNYYERHLGDYARDTAHLSLLEHGVYTLLLDRYYASEEPIPADQVYRLARARSRDEREAVDAILREFFTLDGGVYRNRRTDEEIEKARSRITTAQSNGRRGGRPKKNPMGFKTETHEKPNGFLLGSKTETQTKALHTPDTKLHTPEDQKLPPLPPAGADAPAAADATAPPSAEMQAALAAYHRILPRCQRIAVLNGKRRKRITAACKLARQICRQQGWPYDPGEFWGAYFGECATDPWMRGDVPNPKNPTWRQNLDVLLAEDRFAGVMDRAIGAMRSAA